MFVDPAERGHYYLTNDLFHLLQVKLAMGTLAIDTECVDSDIYSALGFKEVGKGVVGTPRILSLLSSLLEESVQRNEMESETVNFKDNVAMFHGLRAPTISIQHYIDRIFKYAGCSPSCFLVAYIYVDRFVQQTDVHLTSLNVHRLLITSVLVAAKFIDDAFFNNAYYARVGGVSTAELNRLEMSFLFGLDFRLQVTVNTFQRYCCQLQKECWEGNQIERPIRACGIKDSWPSKSDTQCAPTISR
ncbi:hypothetical protein Godav_011254 [Gossypium davidsonii]|uniref:Cyclin n=2 Tax=Gossypium TaxID=3633 RepID=A0A7J8R9A7_GOSDV|nr:hypothetical protein [Gossypium davidsonii]MBA0645485.1 hypothetical protein [Gossypium klotzschianum]